MNPFFFRWLWFIVLTLLVNSPFLWAAPIVVHDALGHTITLSKPAKRIVSLVPHATEMLYAIGAGSQLVAVTDYCHYPPAVLKLPKVGGINGFSLETVLKQRPDLVIAWADDTSLRALERLKQLGVPVYMSQPKNPADIPKEMEKLGQLTGTLQTAQRAANQFRQSLQNIKTRYAGRRSITVFFQLGKQPLFTVSNRSFVGAMIQLCGGQNSFGNHTAPSFQVSLSAVIQARPQVILSISPQDLTLWKSWNIIPATKDHHLFALPTDETSIPGPRLTQGIQAMCEAIDSARHSP